MYTVSPSTKGLIFDLDGTIVDSMPAHLLSWQAAFRAFGETFTEEFCYAHAGVSLTGVVEIFNRENGTSLSPEAVVSKKDEAFVTYLDRIRPIPQVLDILKRYNGKLPMAVASGNTRPLSVVLLERLGLIEYFDALVFGEEVSTPKPDPESFLTAARLMGVPPKTCEVFEDGDHGLAAAKRAGMIAVDIRPWLTATSSQP